MPFLLGGPDCTTVSSYVSIITKMAHGSFTVCSYASITMRPRWRFYWDTQMPVLLWGQDDNAQAKGILSIKGYQNHIICSKVTSILMNGWIFPVCGVFSGRVCAQPAKQGWFSIRPRWPVLLGGQYASFTLNLRFQFHCEANMPVLLWSKKGNFSVRPPCQF